MHGGAVVIRSDFQREPSYSHFYRTISAPPHHIFRDSRHFRDFGRRTERLSCYTLLPTDLILVIFSLYFAWCYSNCCRSHEVNIYISLSLKREASFLVTRPKVAYCIFIFIFFAVPFCLTVVFFCSRGRSLSRGAGFARSPPTANASWPIVALEN